MKKLVLFVTISIVSAACSIPALAQFDVRYEKVFWSKTLSGKTCVGSNEGDSLKGVLVEDMSSNWKTVENSTKTDENGHFSFQSARNGIHYLRLSAYGLSTTYIKVRISSWAKKEELLLKITVAT